MGIFFDEETTTYCVDYDSSQGYIVIPAYLLLTNASTDLPDMRAWEARLVVQGNSSIPTSTWNVVGDSSWGHYQDYIIGVVPYPFTNPVTVLASIMLQFIGDETDPWCTISVGRVTGSLTFPVGPGYTASDGWTDPSGTFHPIECNPIAGTWGEPTAWINHPDGPCDVVNNESMTWGHVKSLYED